MGGSWRSIKRSRIASGVARADRRTARRKAPPKAAGEVECKIEVAISGLPHVVVTEHAHSAVEAFDRAGGRVERLVHRALGRAKIAP